jgi:hypothetical protein
MTEDTDLMPWVLGGMLALGAVAAIAAGSPDPAPLGVPTAPHTAASASTAQAAPSATSASAAQPAPSATSAEPPAAPPDFSPVVVSTNARPQLPPGQVWECDINGQRVFSDTQCGAHATVRQLTETNVIDSGAGYARGAPRPDGYAPGPGYYPQPVPAGEAPPVDAGDPIYTQVLVVHDRPRREQLAHHGNRPHPRAAHP